MKPNPTATETATPRLKVGDTIWVRRAYSHHHPFREQWDAKTITRETSRSWIYGPEWCEAKIPKSTNFDSHFGLALTEERLEQIEWLDTQPSNICRQMQITSFDALTIPQWKQIAAIIGYKEAPDA